MSDSKQTKDWVTLKVRVSVAFRVVVSVQENGSLEKLHDLNGL